MSVSGSRVIWLSDARLRPLALAPLPAWLWSIDATHILWANPTGAAIFGAATPAALAPRRFDEGQPAAAQIARLAATLPSDGTVRLERLRGFGAGVGRALTCACSRITLADATDAVLIAATERAGPDLALVDRLRRLLAGSEAAIAAFASDGALLAATMVAPVRSLAAASLAQLAENALSTGHADGQTEGGPIALDRLDGGGTPVLIATVAEKTAAETQTSAPKRADSDHSQPAIQGIPPRVPTMIPEAPAPSPTSARRHPLRFVWQMDADGRFTIGSNEFLELIGPKSAAALGGRWDDLAARLGIDPDGHIARAINSHDTWSGLSAAWPVDDGAQPLAVELSGLPVFDRDRSFRGYRGFGVCRDLDRLGALAQLRQEEARTRAPTVAGPAPITAAADTKAQAGELLRSVAESAAVENIVQFPAGAAADMEAPTLTPIERRAFSELARRLTTRLNEEGGEAATSGSGAPDDAFADDDLAGADRTFAELAQAAKAVGGQGPSDGLAADVEQELFQPASGGEEAYVATPRETRSILDHLPLGVLVYRLEHLLYANRVFLDWTGHDDLTSLMEAGGLSSLLIQPTGDGADGPTFAVAIEQTDRPTAEGRLIAVQWDGDEAHALIVTVAVGSTRAAPLPVPAAPAVAAAAGAQAEIRELKSMLDTATDGVLVLDREGRIVSANRSAQALFGDDEHALAGRTFSELLVPESEPAARDYLARLLRDDVASVLNRGLDVIGRERHGGLIPLFMTMGRLGEGTDKVCAVFRDITQWKKSEEELTEARRQAERASSAKSDFLAKISHEIRTPLNSIIGFSEVMMQERFGPIGNERYRDYLKDIRASGEHLISLINDLLDLSKIEAGKLELTFAGVALNELVQQGVASLQPQANRERIIIRTSLSPKLPQVTADARSLRQIVLNLLSNSLKFTPAGGQVIVSTTVTDRGEVSLRVRDTGTGMSEQEIATALEPFRQLATSTRFGSGGGGLGLPLTKAMAEANRAHFHISSKPKDGTLVEVTFPKTAVAAE